VCVCVCKGVCVCEGKCMCEGVCVVVDGVSVPARMSPCLYPYCQIGQLDPAMSSSTRGSRLCVCVCVCVV
jgi:hypothetical protein